MSVATTTTPSSPFSPRLVALLVMVAALAAGVLLVLGTFHEELGGGLTDNGGADALSRSAIGYAGLVDLIHDAGYAAELSRDPARNDPDGLLFVAPRLEIDAPKGLKDLDFDGPTLVVLQKWETSAQVRHANWVDKVRPFGGPENKQILGELAPGSEILTASTRVARHRLTGVEGTTLQGLMVSTGPIQGLRTLKPAPDLHPVLVDETGAMVIGRYKDLYYIDAEPDLFATHGLKDISGAQTAFAILDGLGTATGPVLFDLTLSGYGVKQGGIAKALLTPPLLPATLCLILAAVIMAAHAFGRFGPARSAGRVFAFGKRALADNAAALIHLARRESSMALPYAMLTRDLVLEAVGAQRDMTPDQADAFLDRLAATRGLTDSWSGLKAEAERVGNAEDLTRSAAKLFNWKLEMTREHR